MNLPLLRYAEVLLIFAEPENEVENGPTPEAYQAVNLIRKRAELPALSQLDQNSFREAVWKEKWHELSYENKTWLDRKSTRLNSSHVAISYAVFCLKKKTITKENTNKIQ